MIVLFGKELEITKARELLVVYKESSDKAYNAGDKRMGASYQRTVDYLKQEIELEEKPADLVDCPLCKMDMGKLYEIHDTFVEYACDGCCSMFKIDKEKRNGY